MAPWSPNMLFDAPFRLGPFWVDGEGRLTLADPAARASFHFRLHGRLIHAWFDQADPGSGRLTLQVVLARVRSTACAPDQMLRPRTFALLHQLAHIVPADWGMALLVDHRVRLETQAMIGWPITATGLVSELTRFAVQLAPYLELMDRVGLTVSDFSRG